VKPEAQGSTTQAVLDARLRFGTLPPYRLAAPSARLCRLRGNRVSVTAHVPTTEWEERFVRFGGAAAGRVLATRCPPEAVILAVGDAVRRGLPGAERTSFLWRDSETGRGQQAQGGGGFARRFARHHTALAIEGRLDRPSVLIMDEGVEARFVPPEFLRWEVPQRAAWLRAECGGEGWTSGPAAQAGLSFATLASLQEPRSSVGRGGLATALQARNVVALISRAAPIVPQLDARFEQYLQALLRSPHLAARAMGGTLEAVSAAAARGEVAYPEAQQLYGLVDSARQARHGCSGCPTPCGLVFDRPHARQGGRFGAVHTLVERVGLASPEDALDVLLVCDELGVDAKEAALRLSLLQSEAPDQGRAAWAKECLRAWCAGTTPVPAPIAHMEQQLAGSSLATQLALHVSSRGSDPMRVQPFLADLASRTRTAELLAPLQLPVGADDPHDPRGKGRIVWWCENVALALDATGACAFSAAGLLADGVLDLAALARLVVPEDALEVHAAEADAGLRFLGTGVALAALARMVGPRVSSASTTAALTALQQPGMLDEYQRLRGESLAWLDPEWALRSAWKRQMDHDLDAGLAPSTSDAVPARSSPTTARTTVQVEVRTLAPALVRLDGTHWPLNEGDTLADLHQRWAAEDPELARLLAATTVWSGGRRLAPDAPVSAGMVLDLVLALAGG